MTIGRGGSLSFGLAGNVRWALTNLGFSSTPNKSIKSLVINSVGWGPLDPSGRPTSQILCHLERASNSSHFLPKDYTVADSLAIFTCMLVNWSECSLAERPKSLIVSLCREG